MNNDNMNIYIKCPMNSIAIVFDCVLYINVLHGTMSATSSNRLQPDVIRMDHESCDNDGTA